MNSRHKEGPSSNTLAVWAGEEGVDKLGATQMPVVNSVSFDYPDLDAWLDVATGKSAGHIYGRNTNPTVEVFKKKLIY
tara:strand:+ start:252 stop:485 length:234 start_codon:yes stop_codon:yes gene_type:complete